MIDKQYRSIAVEVAQGATLPLSPDRYMQKAIAYGKIARAISLLELPTPDELIGSKPIGWVSTITDIFANDLKLKADRLLTSDPTVYAELDTAMRDRYLSSHGIHVDDAAKKSLHSGINTAMEFEGITLATIQLRTSNGDQITREGLIKSQRIPFAFAMQAIAEHDVYNPDMFTHEFMRCANGNYGVARQKILLPEVYEMTPKQGLRLTVDLPVVPVEQQTDMFRGEPGIGCPATLVGGFVRDLHIVAVEACIQAGVIPVVDS